MIRLARTTLLFLAFAAPAAASPGEEEYRRYRELITRYVADGEEIEGRIRQRIDAVGTDQHGTALDREAILGNIYGVRPLRRSLASMLEQLDARWAELERQQLSLGDFLRRADHNVEYACVMICTIQINECEQATSMIETLQRKKSRQLFQEFLTKKAELEEKYRGMNEALAKAMAALRIGFTEREAIIREEAVRQHAADTQRLLDRRRILAGDLWRLQDFSDRRGRTETAAKILDRVYGLWEMDLERYPHVRTGDGVDRNVAQTNHVYQCDWVQFGFWFLEDAPKELEMEEAIRAVPVETLRQYDDTLPAIVTPNDRLEAACVLLAGRLERHFRVQAALDALYETLIRQTAELRRLPAENSLPDPQPVQDAFTAGVELKRNYDAAVARRGPLEEAREKAKRDHDGAMIDYRLARRDLMLDRNLRPVTAGGQEVEDLVRVKERSLAQARETLNDVGLPPLQRKNTVEVLIPNLEADLRRIESAIEAAARREFDATVVAKGRLDAAELALQRAPRADRRDLEREWENLRARVSSARRQLSAPYADRVPPVVGLSDPEPLKSAEAAVNGLRSVRAEIARARSTGRDAVRRTLSDINRSEAESRSLAYALIDLRAMAPELAADTLVELGADPDNPGVQSLREMASELNTVKETLSPVKKTAARAAEFDRLLRRASGSSAVLQGAKKRLGAVSLALAVTQASLDYAASTERAARSMDDPAAAAEAFAGAASLGGTVSEALGGILGEVGSGYFIGTFTGSVRAAVSLQSRLIEQDFATLVQSRPPELHLYTTAEVMAGSMRASGETACRRIAKMCQVRRLLALVGATELRQVVDRR